MEGCIIMEWKIFNNGQNLEISVEGIKCIIVEDLMDEQVDVFKNINFHLLEIKIDSQKYHSEERRLKFVEQCKKQGLDWDCIQYGYFVLINSDGSVCEINLNIQGLGWGETADLMCEKNKNKVEIDFVQNIINQLSF